MAEEQPQPRDNLPPPAGYDSWLEFAIVNMPTRDLFNSAYRGEQPQWQDQLRKNVTETGNIWAQRNDFKASALREYRELMQRLEQKRT